MEPVRKYKRNSDCVCHNNEIYTAVESGYLSEDGGLALTADIVENCTKFIPVSQDGETIEEMVEAQGKGVRYELYFHSHDSWELTNWDFTDHPSHYRKQQEQSVNPIQINEAYLDAYRELHNTLPFVMRKGMKSYITGYNSDGFILGGIFYLYSCMEKYNITNIDGSPFVQETF